VSILLQCSEVNVIQVVHGMSPMDLSPSCVTGEILIANHAGRFSPHADVARANAKLQLAARSTNHISPVDRQMRVQMRQCAGGS
jgi:hypothetical protein